MPEQETRRFRSEIERRFGDAIEHLATATAVWDLKGRFLRVDRAFCELVGRTEEALLATDRRTIEHPDESEAEDASAELALRRPHEKRRDVRRYCRPDGEILWVMRTLTLVHDESEEPFCFLVQVQDISRFKQAEIGHRDEIARLRAVVDVQHEIASLDAGPGELMDLIARRALTLTGATGAAIEMREGDRMVHAAASGTLAGHEGLQLRVDGSLSGLAVTSGEVMWSTDTETDPRVDREATRRVGSRSMIVVPLERPEGFVGVLKVVSSEPNAFDEQDVRALELIAGLLGAVLGRASDDVEERARNRWRSEEHARQTAEHEELKALDERRNVFLAAAAHDLRGRISAIVGFADLIGLDDERITPERRRDFTARIIRNARRMDRLLSNMLDVDRVARAAFRVVPAPTDLARLIETLVEDWSGEEAHPVEAVLEPLIATVDAGLIERVVENLLLNAMKHTPAGTPVWARLTREGSDAIVSIEDAGPGVPAEDRESIFGMFRRGSQQAAFGTGVGLYLVARFAEMHGGRAWVEERPGGGAAFKVLLPDTVVERAP